MFIKLKVAFKKNYNSRILNALPFILITDILSSSVFQSVNCSCPFIAIKLCARKIYRSRDHSCQMNVVRSINSRHAVIEHPRACLCGL